MVVRLFPSSWTDRADGGRTGPGRALDSFSEPFCYRYTHDLRIFFSSCTEVVQQDLGFSYYLVLERLG